MQPTLSSDEVIGGSRPARCIGALHRPHDARQLPGFTEGKESSIIPRSLVNGGHLKASFWFSHHFLKEFNSLSVQSILELWPCSAPSSGYISQPTDVPFSGMDVAQRPENHLPSWEKNRPHS